MNIPDEDLVIVFTADYPPLFFDHRIRERKIEDFIIFDILPLVSKKAGQEQ